MEPKHRILHGAQELFFKYGIKSVTMDDIAKHLGISKKTIYQFYSDKDDIVHSLMEVKLKEDEVEFRADAEKAQNIIEEVFLHTKRLNHIFSNINPNIFYDLQKFHPKSWALFKTFKEKCIQQIVETALEKGKEQGLVRKEINTKIIAKLRMEEIEMGFNPVLFPPDKYKMAEVQVTFIEHFLYGVCTLKGHKLINKYNEIIEEE